MENKKHLLSVQVNTSIVGNENFLVDLDSKNHPCKLNAVFKLLIYPSFLHQNL